MKPSSMNIVERGFDGGNMKKKNTFVVPHKCASGFPKTFKGKFSLGKSTQSKPEVPDQDEKKTIDSDLVVTSVDEFNRLSFEEKKQCHDVAIKSLPPDVIDFFQKGGYSKAQGATVSSNMNDVEISHSHLPPSIIDESISEWFVNDHGNLLDQSSDTINDSSITISNLLDMSRSSIISQRGHALSVLQNVIIQSRNHLFGTFAESDRMLKYLSDSQFGLVLMYALESKNYSEVTSALMCIYSLVEFTETDRDVDLEYGYYVYEELHLDEVVSFWSCFFVDSGIALRLENVLRNNGFIERRAIDEQCFDILSMIVRCKPTFVDQVFADAPWIYTRALSSRHTFIRFIRLCIPCSRKVSEYIIERNLIGTISSKVVLLADPCEDEIVLDSLRIIRVMLAYGMGQDIIFDLLPIFVKVLSSPNLLETTSDRLLRCLVNLLCGIAESILDMEAESSSSVHIHHIRSLSSVIMDILESSFNHAQLLLCTSSCLQLMSMIDQSRMEKFASTDSFNRMWKQTVSSLTNFDCLGPLETDHIHQWIDHLSGFTYVYDAIEIGEDVFTDMKELLFHISYGLGGHFRGCLFFTHHLNRMACNILKILHLQQSLALENSSVYAKSISILEQGKVISSKYQQAFMKGVSNPIWIEYMKRSICTLDQIRFIQSIDTVSLSQALLASLKKSESKLSFQIQSFIYSSNGDAEKSKVPWMFRILSNTSNQQTLKSILEYTILYILSNECKGESPQISWISGIFLSDEYLYLDPTVNTCLEIVLDWVLSSACETNSIEVGDSQFAQLLERFTADSFGSSSFHMLLLYYISQSCPIENRITFWTEVTPLLTRIQLSVPDYSRWIHHFITPLETDPRLLRLYHQALISKKLDSNRNEILFKIATSHLSGYIFNEAFIDPIKSWRNGRGQFFLQILESLGATDPSIQVFMQSPIFPRIIKELAQETSNSVSINAQLQLVSQDI